MPSSLFVQFEHSGMRCGEIVRTKNETVFPAHINFSVGSTFQNALCSADDATNGSRSEINYVLVSFKNKLWLILFMIYRGLGKFCHLSVEPNL